MIPLSDARKLFHPCPVEKGTCEDRTVVLNGSYQGRVHAKEGIE